MRNFLPKWSHGILVSEKTPILKRMFELECRKLRKKVAWERDLGVRKSFRRAPKYKQKQAKVFLDPGEGVIESSWFFGRTNTNMNFRCLSSSSQGGSLFTPLLTGGLFSQRGVSCCYSSTGLTAQRVSDMTSKLNTCNRHLWTKSAKMSIELSTGIMLHPLNARYLIFWNSGQK